MNVKHRTLTATARFFSVVTYPCRLAFLPQYRHLPQTTGLPAQYSVQIWSKLIWLLRSKRAVNGNKGSRPSAGHGLMNLQHRWWGEKGRESDCGNCFQKKTQQRHSSWTCSIGCHYCSVQGAPGDPCGSKNGKFGSLDCAG